jgi:hypothetical protein
MEKIDSENLTKEIGLLDIYRATRNRLPLNKIEFLSSILIITLLAVYVFYSSESSFELLEKTRKWSELAFNFSVGILGFLLAGFTIFATVSDKSLFVAMAKAKHRKSGLNYLKYNFFSLMYVFIVYLGLAILCLLIQLLGSSSGLISILLRFSLTQLISDSEEYFNMAKMIISKVSIVVVGTWFFYSLILLQSFIFNIYHIVMTAIRWEIENQQNDSSP